MNYGTRAFAVFVFITHIILLLVTNQKSDFVVGVLCITFLQCSNCQ